MASNWADKFQTTSQRKTSLLTEAIKSQTAYVDKLSQTLLSKENLHHSDFNKIVAQKKELELAQKKLNDLKRKLKNLSK